MRRLLSSALLVVLLVPGLAACGEREDQRNELRSIVNRTRHRSAELVYRDTREKTEVKVTAVIEDDFRFKALVGYGDEPGYEQVVHDDALALRFLNPSFVPTLIDRSRLNSVDLHTDREGITVLEALQSGRWVVDEGAAPLVARAPLGDDLGRDFVLDALTSLDYVNRAIDEAVAVERWADDDLSPAYSSSEDNFPKPEEGSGVVRYDLRRPDLPSGARGASGPGGETQVLGTRHFRKMAIYVKDDRIIRVIERIEAIGKQTEDLRDYVENFLKEAKVPASDQRQYRELIARTAEKDLGAVLLKLVNALLRAAGQEPIVVREMTLDLKESGSATIAMPGSDVIKAPLDLLTISGAAQQKAEEAGAAAEEYADREVGDTLGSDQRPSITPGEDETDPAAEEGSGDAPATGEPSPTSP